MHPARALAVVAVAGVLALVPAGAWGGTGCAPVGTTPDEGHQHLLGDAPPPVGYRTTPPASGWHYRERGRVHLGVQPATEPLTEPEQVSVLAVGGVVISYHDVDEAGVAALEQVVAEARPSPVTLAAYDALEPGQVAFTAWRTLQRCTGADPAAAAAFVETYAAAEPDFAMTAGSDAHDHDAAAAPGAADADGSGRVPVAVVVVAGAGAAALLGFAGWRALARPGQS